MGHNPTAHEGEGDNNGGGDDHDGVSFTILKHLKSGG